MKDLRDFTREEYGQQVHDAGKLFTAETSETIWNAIADCGKKIIDEGEIHPVAMEHALWMMFLGIMMYPFQEADLETQKRAFGRFAVQLRAVMENEAIHLGIHPK